MRIRQHQDEYYEVKDQRYLGGDNFVEAVCRSINEQEQASPVKITMEEVLTALAKETELTIRVLLGKGRGRVESRLMRRRPMSSARWAESV